MGVLDNYTYFTIDDRRRDLGLSGTNVWGQMNARPIARKASF
jgi:hypothetical protein